ncbi:MAG: InlB B-repeat-containing protein [Candidatus Coproplasma sp.]
MKRKWMFLSVLIFTLMLFSLMLFGCSSDGDNPAIEEKEYTIMYSDGDSIHTLTVKYGELYTIEKPLPEKEGYVFAGLFDAEVGGSQYVTSTGISVSPFYDNKNIVLYPQFTASSFTITLDYGEASVTGSQTLTVQYGEQFPVLPVNLTVPDKFYMIFDGWYTASNCGGEQIADKTGFSTKKLDKSIADLADSNGNLTLYAGFRLQTYTVSFYEQGGASLIKKVEAEHGTEISAIMPATTAENKKILTWTSGNGSIYSETTVKSDISLYVLSYACNIVYDYAYDGKKETVTVANSNLYNLLQPVREGYSFIGWYNNNEQLPLTISINDDLQLTAKWKANNYLITYSVNNAEGTIEDTEIELTYGTSFNLAVPESNRTEYDFDGWYTQDGIGLTDSNGKSVSLWSIAEDTVIYAHWKLITYTVTLNANGGTNGGNSIVNRGSDFTVPISSKTGYTFGGWYDDTTGVKYTDSFIVTKNISMTAKWTAKTYIITLDTQGGTVSTDTVLVKYNSLYNLPVPSRGTDVFIGWFTLATGGTQLTTDTGSANNVWNKDENISVYAHWRQLRTINLDSASPYTITIGNEDGIVLKGTEGKTYTGFNVEICDSAIAAYIYLENANIVGNSPNGTIYSVNGNSRTVTIISTGTENAITGYSGADGINVYKLLINGSAPLTVIGGEGATANTAGGNGSDGGAGIRAQFLDIQINSELTVKGGNGGNGADGLSGINYTTTAADGKDGADGGKGNSGGIGGNGSHAIIAYSIEISGNSTKANFVGGNGGNGGFGGDGGQGQRGGYVGPAFVYGNTRKSGIGGEGGTGGNGGKGGNAVYVESSFVLSSGNCSLTGGTGGTGGNGGNGGKGGKGAENGWNAAGKGKGANGGNGGNGGDGGNAGLSCNKTITKASIAILKQINGSLGCYGLGGEGGAGGEGCTTSQAQGYSGNSGDNGQGSQP